MTIMEGWREPGANMLKKCVCGETLVKKVERIQGQKVAYWECPRCKKVSCNLEK